MSETLLPSQSAKRNPFAGIVPVVLALFLAAIYFRYPAIAASWPPPGHLFFRGLVVMVGLFGLSGFFGTAWRYRPKLPAWMSLTQHRMSVPLEGWIYLAIIIVVFTGAVLTKQNTLMLVFALMAGPFVINGWMTFGMLQAAKVGRLVPQRAMQGELFSVEVSLKNTRPLFAIWMMSVRDEVSHTREKLDATVLFSRVSPRTSQTGQYQLRLAWRGRHRFGPVRVASRFPLGLVERQRIFSISGEVLIYPRIGRISPGWRQRLDGATELVTRNQPHHGVFHDDFQRLREFRPGDNPRAIHWRSTARRGELILREFQQNREHTLAIVLDLFQSSSSLNEIRERTDFALSFIASLLVDRGRECRDGFLTFAASGETSFRWEGHGNAIGLEAAFDGLAVLAPGPASEIYDLLTETLQHSPASAQILLVTTRPGPLPYQSILSSRVDVLNVCTADRDQLLIFEDEIHSG